MSLELRQEMAIGYGLVLAVVLLAGGFALRGLWRGRGDDLSRRAFWLLNGLVFWMLCVPLAVRALITQTWLAYLSNANLFASAFLQDGGFLILIALGFGLGAWWIVRWQPSGRAYLLGLFIPAYLIVHIVYLAAIDPAPVSDFMRMWDLVRRVADEHKLLLPGDFKDPYLALLLYLRRILPVWSPLALVFGASPWVYKISNLLFLLASELIAYDLAAKYYGRRAAQLATWLMLFVPELLFSIGIPTHDLTGAFLLMVFLLLYDRLYVCYRIRRMRMAIACGVAAGIVWLMVDLQRDYGIFIAAAMLLFNVVAAAHLFLRARAAGRRSPWQAVVPWMIFMLFVPYGVYKASGAAARGAGLYEARHQSPFFTYIFTSLDNVNGSYDDATRISAELMGAQARAVPAQSDPFWEKYYLNAILSEFRFNQLRYFPQWLNRNARFLNLGGSSFFYYEKMTPESPVQLDSPWLRRLKTYNSLFAWPFLALSAPALAWMLASPGWRLRSYPPLVLLATMIGIVCAIAEVQPRYAYPIWLILPIYIGGAADRWLGAPAPPRREQGGLAWGAAAALFGGGGCFLLAMALYGFASGQLIPQWRWSVETSLPGAANDADAAIVPAPNQIRLTTSLPRPPAAGDWVRASYAASGLDPQKTYCIVGEIFAPSVHVAAGQPETLEVEVSVNGKTMETFKGAALTGARFAVLPGIHPAASGEIRLQIETKALAAIADPQWKNLTTVQISRFCIIPEP